jgi:hypothetical protein
MRVQVAPEVLRWASERAQRDGVDVKKRFKQLAAWEKGEARPTLKQLEAFAKATHTPVGSYFVPAPPVESLPIADFRVGPEFRGDLPSGNLLDTIYACQRRQDWLADHARLERFDPVEWIGGFSLDDSPAAAATKIRHELKLDPGDRGELGDWRDFIAS